MATIIAGRFDTQVQADGALDALIRGNFGRENVTSFYLNPPGQHAQYPIGGDAHHDEGTKKSGPAAAAGATIGGVTGAALGTAAAALAEPGFAAAGAIGGAGVGAYVGSLAGGLSGTEAGDPKQASVEEPVERNAGVMVAIRADDNEDEAIQTLRAHGAEAIERASGTWSDGTWTDFDARRSPQLVDERSSAR
jgi:hypothetical protein